MWLPLLAGCIVLPRSQLWHNSLPTLVLCFPDMHGAQSPATPACPWLQAHWVREVLLLGLSEYCGHGMHAVAPEVFWYVSSSQASHVLLAAADLLPAAHSTHVAAAPGPALPAAHASQLLA